ncbi:cytochrome c family protein [Rhodoblastus acidophilus]|uniref:Cytochrome c family protein n=1 Tax=Candidatus Rhodoblastus alkanivorans TaxID=2954117 RepID=A0ABS9Z4R8_9HYPH|nr:cytochrome c family protein [Candidatus Rhodoblastus alkanivorans]MCI4677593.1 cytochrome c family protein [Candidatus Rhodoblastus alkanivorans]MCI4682675.1 cytochrome c family protein [Candidatus Rhodoblastus alkanivorans]MDI4639982.1 cytochrome c family protein [Rhodoblastus acidophilus]
MRGKILVLSGALFAALAFGAQAAQLKGDPKAGEIVFNQCRQCHHIGKGATNFYGPVLNGIIDRPAGTVPGYNYSEANKHSGKVWNVATLTSYLKQPQHDVPKTYMTFKGLKGDQDIANVIAYMSQFDRSGAMHAPTE